MLFSRSFEQCSNTAIEIINFFLFCYFLRRQVLDASGSVASGFVWGNNYWLGSKKACDLVNSPVRVVLSKDLPKNHLQNLTEIQSPFPVDYKLIWAKHRSQWQLDITTFEKVIWPPFFLSLFDPRNPIEIISFIFFSLSFQTMLHVGLCLPQICSNEDVHLLVDAMLNGREFGQKYFIDQTFTIIESKTIKLRDDFFQMTMSNIFL